MACPGKWKSGLKPVDPCPLSPHGKPVAVGMYMQASEIMVFQMVQDLVLPQYGCLFQGTPKRRGLLVQWGGRAPVSDKINLCSLPARETNWNPVEARSPNNTI